MRTVGNKNRYSMHCISAKSVPFYKGRKPLSLHHLTCINTNALGKSQKTLSIASFTPLDGVRITKHSPTIRKKVMKRMERTVPGPVMSV